MIRHDMPEVLEIEQSNFGTPWTEDDFLRELRRRECIGMVAEIGDRVVGFMIYDLHRQFLRILTFAVHPEFRRSGVGRQMAAKLASKLSAFRRTRVDAFVPESNMDGLLFLRSVGFRAVKVLRNHFESEDGYAMEHEVEVPR